MQQFSDKYP